MGAFSLVLPALEDLHEMESASVIALGLLSDLGAV